MPATHEQHGAVVAEDQQGQQGDDIDRHHDPVAHERLQEQGDQREGDEQQGLFVHPHQDERHQGAQQEHDDQVGVEGIGEDPGIVEPDGQVQQDQDGQGDQDIAGQHQDGRPRIAHIGFKFTLVGVQHLGDLRRHDLPLANDQLAGADIARSGRNAGRGLRMDQGRGLLVIEQVRHQEFVGAGGAKQRIHIGAGHPRQVGEQA